jgi:two-component system, OmpR family, phosphate regulon sensor histidine kinase PhoR
MKRKQAGRLGYLHFLLFFYIIIQLGWWAYLISDLTQKVYEDDPRLHQKIWMVWGEGIVFACILLIGFIFTYKSYLRELLAARQQRNFLLSVTHEFKTPISSLRLMLETLQNRTISEEKKNELIRRALTDTDRLNTLADNILHATRMDEGSYPVFRERNNLSLFLEQQVGRLQSSPGMKHTIKTEITPGILFSFDAEAFVSIISNLFENAVKYSPAGTEITISLKQTGKNILLEVADHGAGISIADQKRVFERFVRLESEETRQTKGTGLGLFIVKYLVEKHGGKISVHANKPNGSRFSIILSE